MYISQKNQKNNLEWDKGCKPHITNIYWASICLLLLSLTSRTTGGIYTHSIKKIDFSIGILEVQNVTNSIKHCNAGNKTIGGYIHIHGFICRWTTWKKKKELLTYIRLLPYKLKFFSNLLKIWVKVISRSKYIKQYQTWKVVQSSVWPPDTKQLLRFKASHTQKYQSTLSTVWAPAVVSSMQCPNLLLYLQF